MSFASSFASGAGSACICQHAASTTDVYVTTCLSHSEEQPPVSGPAFMHPALQRGSARSKHQPRAQNAPGSPVSGDLRRAAPAPPIAPSAASSLPAAAAEAASTPCALLAPAAAAAACDASNTTPAGFTGALTATPLMPAQRTKAAVQSNTPMHHNKPRHLIVFAMIFHLAAIEH